MADNKPFIPILLLVWVLVVLLLASAFLSIPNDRADSAPSQTPVAEQPHVRPTTVLPLEPPTPTLTEYHPAEYKPPPNKAQTDKKPFPILEFIAVQLIFFIFSFTYIRIRFKPHLEFLKEKHPTLGNFTNVKYTHIRFISTADLLFLIFSYNTMLAILYIYTM